MKYSILLITIFTAFYMTIVAEEDPLARQNAYREKQAKKPPKQVYPYYANPDGIEENYTYGTSPLKTLYVSPDGSGNTFSLKKPGQLSEATLIAAPGATIRLLPGTYEKIEIEKSGLPEKEITYISDSKDPRKFAIIDGGGPGDEGYGGNPDGYKGIIIIDSSWIVIENIKFRNCWRQVIRLADSAYITVRGCDFYEGKSLIEMVGQGSHHVLVEKNHWLQHKGTWNEFSWEDTHHGKYQRYNGSIISTIWKSGPEGVKSPGAVVIRDNHIEYAFNGVNVWAENEQHSANYEIYRNHFSHIHDNVIEPERFTVNMHVYHNTMNNCQSAVFSLLHGDEGPQPDTVNNGPMYIYGNTGYFDSSDRVKNPDPWKKKSGYIGNGKIIKNVRWFNKKTPVYFYHNTFINYESIGDIGSKKYPEDGSIHVYNNIFETFSGKQGKTWGLYPNTYITKERGNYFDFNFLNGPIPDHFKKEGQEKNGIQGDGKLIAGVVSAEKGDFRLKKDSPCIDKGKVIDGFTVSYTGKAPDMGAWEDGKRVEGPPFYTVVPKGGLGYKEKPRITRHHVEGKNLTLFWSWKLNKSSVASDKVTITLSGMPVPVTKIVTGSTGREMIITTGAVLDMNTLQVTFKELPLGENGERATMWGFPFTN